jgi:hypothetical protein
MLHKSFSSHVLEPSVCLLFAFCLHTCAHYCNGIFPSLGRAQRLCCARREKRREEKRGRSVRESLVPTPIVFRASTAVLSRLCDPGKIFLTSKVSYLLSSNATHKTKTETGSKLETTNTKPPGPSIMIGRSETGSSSQIIFVTLFSRRSGRC